MPNLVRALAHSYRRRRDRPCLLMHGIGSGDYDLTPQLFREMIRQIREAGWQAVSTEHLYRYSAPRKVGLTFDDGLANVFDNAMPILQDAGFVATVFVSPALVGRRVYQNFETGEWAATKNPKRNDPWVELSFMSWSQLHQLCDLGWEVGSHGLSHHDLVHLPQHEVEHELQQSRRRIRSELNVSCDSLAFPWGKFNRAVISAVPRAGYIRAFATAMPFHRLIAYSPRFTRQRFSIDRAALHSPLDEASIIQLMGQR